MAAHQIPSRGRIQQVGDVILHHGSVDAPDSLFEIFSLFLLFDIVSFEPGRTEPKASIHAELITTKHQTDEFGIGFYMNLIRFR
jgi:hypothetical protein